MSGSGPRRLARPLLAAAAGIVAIGVSLAASAPSSIVVHGTLYTDRDGATTCNPSVSAVELVGILVTDGAGNRLGEAVTGQARVTAGSRTSKLMTEFPMVRCWAQASFTVRVPVVERYVLSVRGPVHLPAGLISFGELVAQGFQVALGEGSVYREAQLRLSRLASP